MTLPGLGLGDVLALACGTSWAVAIILFKVAGDGLSPMAAGLFKNVFALACFSVLLAVGGTPLPVLPAGDWAWLVVSAVLGISVADAMFLHSLNLLGAGRHAVVDCVYIPAMTLWAVLLRGDRVGAAFAAGTVLIAGGILLSGWEARGTLARGRILRGVVYGVGAILLMAGVVVQTLPIAAKTGASWYIATRLAVASLASLAMLCMAGGGLRALRAYHRGVNWPALAGASFFGTFLSLWFWIKGFEHGAVPRIAALNQVSVFLTILMAWGFLREPMTWRKVAGVALGFAGVVVIQQG